MNTFGTHFRLTTWGESHGFAIGGVVDGCPAGLPLSEKDVQKDLDRRKPRQSKVTTQRKEQDRVHILSGVFKGKTTGAPISLIIWNKDQHSKDYDNLKNVYRPGAADFTYAMKYGNRDYRGGGRASARETAVRVAAGAIAKKLLTHHKVRIYGFTRQVGDIVARVVQKNEIEKNIVRAANAKDAKKIIELIESVRAEGDSIGGVVEVVAEGVPVGWGSPIYAKLSAKLAEAMMSINAVKGVEIGDGFAVAGMHGSQDNDTYAKKGGKIVPATNHAGGIVGGIATGAPIVVRIAIKPTSSIAKPQQMMTKTGTVKKIAIKGRHDPCLCPRAVPVAEAMMALTLVDAMLASNLYELTTTRPYA